VAPVSENARSRLATVIGNLSSEGYLPKIANVHA
jgi:hypothetical protein